MSMIRRNFGRQLSLSPGHKSHLHIKTYVSDTAFEAFRTPGREREKVREELIKIRRNREHNFPWKVDMEPQQQQRQQQQRQYGTAHAIQFYRERKREKVDEERGERKAGKGGGRAFGKF